MANVILTSCAYIHLDKIGLKSFIKGETMRNISTDQSDPAVFLVVDVHAALLHACIELLLHFHRRVLFTSHAHPHHSVRRRVDCGVQL